LDLLLQLFPPSFPPPTLGGSARLGWTSWLAPSGRPRHRGDLLFSPERKAPERHPPAARQALAA
jgi:predicted component of type VI protein secretion system